jgi:hypothetical protein
MLNYTVSAYGRTVDQSARLPIGVAYGTIGQTEEFTVTIIGASLIPLFTTLPRYAIIILPGDVAQLEERDNRTVEVRGSSPLISTFLSSLSDQ